MKAGSYLTNLSLPIELSFHSRGSKKLLLQGKVQLRIFERGAGGHIGSRYGIVDESVVIGLGPLKGLVGVPISFKNYVPKGIPLKEMKVLGVSCSLIYAIWYFEKGTIV